MKQTAHIRRRLGSGVQIVLVGALTGALVGVLVSLYAALAAAAEDFARGYYRFFLDHPAFVPLLFLALALGAIVVGGVVRFLPLIRGSGIPQTEGAMRGLMRFHWYRELTGMFAVSGFSIFMGLSAGGEGPSILIGGALGHGASDLLRRNALIRRYQITGGACAGLAVAFNAPLTGMAFAFEEGQKRFTPEVFFCAVSAVVVAVLMRMLLAVPLGLPVGAYFSTFVFADFTPVFYAYVLGAALLTALLGVGTYYLIFLARRLFGKVKFWKGTGKFLIPFLFAGAAGLISLYAIGGGHAFISDLGSASEASISVFSSPLWASLLIVVVLKLVATVLNMGAGVPCGAFVPMLAIGAGLGALLSLLAQTMGMDPAYTDMLIVICMATYFTAIAKAPFTGIVMTVELTWNFMFLLPAVMGVAAGYLVGDIFHTKPVYERLLDEMLEEEDKPALFTARFYVNGTGMAAGRRIRDVLWPADVRITRIERGEERILPDGNTLILEGDILTAEGEEEESCTVLAEIIGPRTE